MTKRRTTAALGAYLTGSTGNIGDTLFSSGGSAGFNAEPVISSVRMIDTDDDLNAEKLIVPNLNTIYNSWDRVGMTAYDSNGTPQNEQQGWAVDSSTGAVSSSINSVGPIGFMTPDRYEDYDLEVQITSTNSDDDTVGVILAAVYRDNAQYILTAERSCGDVGVSGGGTWSVCVSKITATGVNRTLILNKSLPIAFGDGSFGNNKAESGYVSNNGHGWSTHPNGTYIKVNRNGNTITLQTTQLDSATYVAAANITLDLTTIYSGWFATSSPFGLMAYSQAATTYNITNITVNDNYIYDARNGNVWTYSGGAWSNTSTDGFNIFKVGHLYYNPNTLKNFFYPRQGVIRAISKGS